MSKNRFSVQKPKIITPEFTDSEIDVLPMDIKRDAVRRYIMTLEAENLSLRQTIELLDKPLNPKPMARPARKGKL